MCTKYVKRNFPNGFEFQFILKEIGSHIIYFPKNPEIPIKVAWTIILNNRLAIIYIP